MDQTYISDFLQANNFLIQGHLDESLSLFSSLLSTNPVYDVYINRSIAYQKKCDFQNALTDSESAILLDPSRSEAFLNRGIANFNLGKYENALTDLKEAKNKNASAKIIDIWMSKCNLEIRLQVPEKKQPAIEKKPQVEKNEQETQNNEGEGQEKDEHFDLLKEKVFSSTGLLNYSWYQTDNHIGLEWDHKIEDKELITHKFENKKICISFPIANISKPYQLELNLWDEIVPENAKIIVTLTKVEVKFEKKKQEEKLVTFGN